MGRTAIWDCTEQVFWILVSIELSKPRLPFISPAIYSSLGRLVRLSFPDVAIIVQETRGIAVVLVPWLSGLAGLAGNLGSDCTVDQSPALSA